MIRKYRLLYDKKNKNDEIDYKNENDEIDFSYKEYHIYEGDGSNLDQEAIENGFVDYLMIDSYIYCSCILLKKTAKELFPFKKDILKYLKKENIIK